MKKKIVAMLLAGGQGSRLGVLTSSMAKPAVPFGGKYRIIDFPLSNCTNSHIDTVGVLTQYLPLALNSYIGNGQHWDLDRVHGGVFVLPPYMTGKSGHWYTGTANAIFQNREFIEQYNPDYVLILSGDHIYRMDYSKMLSFHEKKGAAATIAVFPVPMEEAHRFGIMNTDAENRITSFEEKPKEPKSNLASMGVYIFNWPILRQYMESDDADPASEHDFGKNIIPAILNAGLPMYAYAFHGYWKDVGTIQSLWDANMDLISDPPRLLLDDPNWRIYSKNPISPPHHVGSNACIRQSLVSEGSSVDGRVERSVLFYDVSIAADAEIYDSVIFPGAIIGSGTKVFRSIIGENAVIGSNCIIGGPLRAGDVVDNKLTGDITVIGDDLYVNAGTYLPCGSIVNEDIQGGRVL